MTNDMVDAPAFVELNPAQAWDLMFAWSAEQDRVRHEAEGWTGGVGRDIEKRERRIRDAIARGVPAAQAQRFVFSGPREQARESADTDHPRGHWCPDPNECRCKTSI